MLATRIKTIAWVGFLAGALLPSAVFAAFDDLTSATLETLVVNENTFVVTLEDSDIQ